MSWRGGTKGWLVAGSIVTGVYLFFVGIPLIALFARGFGEEGFWSGLGDSTVLNAMRISITTSFISIVIIALLGTPVAYFLARRRFPGHGFVDSMIELPMVLPPVVIGLAMLMAFGRNSFIGNALETIGVSLPFSLTAVVFAQIFVGAPFFLRAAKLGFEAVDRELEDVGQTLGLSPLRTFFRVSLPLARRPLIGGLVLAWARAIAEFGATIMFAGNLAGHTQTMPLAILSALETNLGSALALAVILVLMATIVLTLVRRLAVAQWEAHP